jgi:hypothetical protein
MTTPAILPDAERLTADLLTVLLADEEVDVGIGVPSKFRPGENPPWVQVSQDSAAVPRHRAIARAIERITVWSDSPSTSKRLLLLAEARLAAWEGDDQISTISTATGLFTARDRDNRGAELASCTVRVTVRSAPPT